MMASCKIANCTPLHPYDIMLCNVSKHLTRQVEMMHRLGRLMGCRDTRDVKCPSLLFQKLEEAGALSEFSVSKLRNALEMIDLPQAAILVRGYEDYLSGQESEVASSGDPCSPPKTPPPSDATSDDTGENERRSSMPPPYSFVQSGDQSLPSGVPTVSSSVTEGSVDETLPPEEDSKRELNSRDAEPGTTGRRKYHTINPSTMRRDYPDLKFDFFQKRD